MTQTSFAFFDPAPPVSLPPLMPAPSSSDESEQAAARIRVYECLVKAGKAGLTTPQLIEASRSYAAVRRVWELITAYGYDIRGARIQRNAWHWTFVGPERWARPPVMPYKQAKQLETARLQAIGSAGNAPTGAVRQGR